MLGGAQLARFALKPLSAPLGEAGQAGVLVPPCAAVRSMPCCFPCYAIVASAAYGLKAASKMQELAAIVLCRGVLAAALLRITAARIARAFVHHSIPQLCSRGLVVPAQQACVGNVVASLPPPASPSRLLLRQLAVPTSSQT